MLELSGLAVKCFLHRPTDVSVLLPLPGQLGGERVEVEVELAQLLLAARQPGQIVLNLESSFMYENISIFFIYNLRG